MLLLISAPPFPPEYVCDRSSEGKIVVVVREGSLTTTITTYSAYQTPKIVQ